MDAHKTAVGRSGSTCPTSTRSGSPRRTASASRTTSRSLEQELSGHLLEHARHHDYDLLTRPVVDLGPGRAAAPRRVRDPDPPGRGRPQRQGAEPEQGEQGHTMVYSAAAGAEGRSPSAVRDAALLGDPGDRLAWTTAATCSTGRRRRSGARRRRDCVHRRPQRLAPPRRAAPLERRRTGRSSTSARPTGSRSTAAGSPSTRLCSGRRGHPRDRRSSLFDIEQ